MNLDGGIHEIPLPGRAGRLWLCGKHAIAPDPRSVLEDLGAVHVVCLVERHEIDQRYPDYVEWLERSGEASWLPIPDLDFLSIDRISPFLDGISARLERGESLIAHCAAGIGRAGTLAVCLCLDLGMSLDEALRHVRLHRPGAGPEVGAQMDCAKARADRSSRSHE